MTPFYLSSNEKKFVFRSILFVIVLVISIYDITLLKQLLTAEVGPFLVYHVLWFLFLLEMIVIFVPSWSTYVGCGKHYAKHFKAASYNEGTLADYTKKFNRRVLYALLIWLSLLFLLALLYLAGFISKIGLFLLFMFLYFADQFFINIWCPFRSWIIRNKCCNACRIYNWGHIMMFSSLIFIPSFWTWSLIAVSLAILVQWEYQHYRYPERFSEASNLNLRCSHCKDKCRKRDNSIRYSLKIEKHSSL